ncbi:hypothetical protein [Kingella potus]|uniref:hypothetical protein n=1 Tax=Kingella potus TaxID=265175 RepID=UPI001FD13E10|nr:hypothetical protein [Kingella potus]UOP01500.1 hypothetical protein LVJ84_04730 [Kingella potus]
MSKDHEAAVTAALKQEFGADNVYSQVPYRLVDSETGRLLDLGGIMDNIVIIEQNGRISLQLVEAKSTWAHQDALNSSFRHRNLLNQNQKDLYAKIASGKYKILISENSRVGGDLMKELNKRNAAVKSKSQPGAGAFDANKLPNLETDIRLEMRVYLSKEDALKGSGGQKADATASCSTTTG